MRYSVSDPNLPRVERAYRAAQRIAAGEQPPLEPRCHHCGEIVHFEDFLGAWIHSGEDDGSTDHNVEI